MRLMAIGSLQYGQRLVAGIFGNSILFMHYVTST